MSTIKRCYLILSAAVFSFLLCTVAVLALHRPQGVPPVPVPQAVSSSQEASVDSAPESSAQSSVSSESGYWSGNAYIYRGKGFSPFNGSETTAANYADAINPYADEFSGVRIYCMVVPTNIAFALPESEAVRSANQMANINTIYRNLSLRVTPVDAYGALDSHRGEYLYFNTDHHWTGRGAYYAYAAFARKAGFVPLPLGSLETRRLDSFLGTIYDQTGDPSLRENPDFVDYYIIPGDYDVYRYVTNEPFTAYPSSLHGEYAAGVNSYSVFLHGDFPLIKIETQNRNGRRILVSKDSFGNALAPFLAAHYETVLIADERYLQRGVRQLVAENDINEILFINNIFAANTPSHIYNIKSMRNDRYLPEEISR